MNKKGLTKSIMEITCYQTTDKKAFYGEEAFNKAVQWQKVIDLKATKKKLTKKVMDLFGTGPFKLSIAPDGEEAKEKEVELLNIWGSNELCDKDSDDATETFEDLTGFFLDFEQTFPGVLLNIAKLIHSK